ncbi:MAG: hypothetical protein HRT42_11140 [Campylobacteraceae bacterium]|nr:hypothetical protein [Campylobacteraceae bacterium]
MNKIDSCVISSINEWIKEDKEFYLCTIISAKGASVRPLGSLFAYNGENKIGFISEPRSDDAFCRIIENNKSRFEDYS